MINDDVDQDIGEDILYQKDASFSAELDSGVELEDSSQSTSSSTTTTIVAVRFVTTTSKLNSEHKLPLTSREIDELLSTTTSAPCLLDCSAGGQCTSEGATHRCQCPLGRSGTTCDTGTLVKKVLEYAQQNISNVIKIY